MSALRIFCQIAVLLPVIASAQIAVTLSGADTGRIFEGIGATDGGTTSRLLADYPTQQQSEILDFLFKPNYGAALHHFKVEIGSDANSTEGSAASHERSAGVINCNRGYEWSMMQAAVARNPSIILDSLMWGTAGWVGTFYSASNITYVKDWLDCAASHGLNIQYTGIWNETGSNTQWTKDLHAALVAGGYSTKIATDDNVSSWAIASTIAGDSALAASVYAVAQHYAANLNTYPNSTVKGLGKPLWDSEDGTWPVTTPSSTWSAAQYWAKVLNRNYITGQITKTEFWNLITSYYNKLPIPGAGLMAANTPWSGNYSVSPIIWTMAHTTQFAQPGWQYLDAACALVTGGTGGSYVALKSTNGTDYSIIVESTGAGGSQAFTFTISGGLTSGAVHVWKSTSSSQFIQQADITPSAGSFSFTAAADSIYTLTTTTGQGKGSTSPPADFSFPFPYVDNFDSYGIDKNAHYLSDVQGAFEVQSCIGRSGKCVQQTAPTPIPWHSSGGSPPIPPLTIIGDATWTDYLVSVDSLLQQAGAVRVIVRMISQPQTSEAVAYEFTIDDTGAWAVILSNGGLTTLGSGSLIGGFGLNTWHNLQVKCTGIHFLVSVDGTQIANISSNVISAGMVGIGTSGYIGAQFDNFGICNNSGCPSFPGLGSKITGTISATGQIRIQQ